MESSEWKDNGGDERDSEDSGIIGKETSFNEGNSSELNIKGNKSDNNQQETKEAPSTSDNQINDTPSTSIESNNNNDNSNTTPNITTATTTVTPTNLKNVHVFYYPWYGNIETDGKWNHWNHHILPHWSRDVKEKVLFYVLSYCYVTHFACSSSTMSNTYRQMTLAQISIHLGVLTHPKIG